MRKVYLLLFSLLTLMVTGARADDTVSLQEKYGLKDNIQDGVILHCFDWKLTDIQAELENIAEAGFTAVQTSPLHKGETGASSWYMAYQPAAYSIGNYLGTADDLTNLCTAAHKYGIKIIVDVVANHTNGNLSYVDEPLNDTKYYHTNSHNSNNGDVNWSNRWDVTTAKIGMWDLNTNDTYVQSIIKDYIAALKACGVDGIRWDAAKHIALPDEADDATHGTVADSFWANVPDQTMYNYGEILNNTGGDDNTLLPDYQKYMSITDNGFGNDLAASFNSGSINGSVGNFKFKGASENKLVYWGESHDTYCNDNGTSKNYSQSAVDRAYAVVAGVHGATALYFSRPTNSKVSSEIKLGDKGSTHFTSPEVAEVNHLHNLCSDESNWQIHTSSVDAQIRKSGVIITTASSSGGYVSFDNADKSGNYLPAGTYTDHVTGTNTFTVTASTISGTVGSTGIAVLYDDSAAKLTLTPDGGTFTGNNTTVTLKPNLKTTSYWYKVGDADAVTINGGTTTTLTIGDDLGYGGSVTITWGATNGTKETTGSATFTKQAVTATDDTIDIYVMNGESSKTPKFWAWDSKGASLNTTNAKWPGDEMTQVTINGTKYYHYSFNANPVNVIFSYTGDNDKTGSIENITSDRYYYFESKKAVDITGSHYDPVVETSALTASDPIYCFAPTGKSVNFYIWNKSNGNNWENASWSGVAGEKSVATETYYSYTGYTSWSWTRPSTVTVDPLYIIINDGSTQTADYSYKNGVIWTWSGSSGYSLSSVDVVKIPVFGTSATSASREFKAGVTSTFALPFSLTATQVSNLGGKVYKLSSYDSEGVIHFEETTTVDAYHPYIFVADKNCQPFAGYANWIWQAGSAQTDTKGGISFVPYFGQKKYFPSTSSETIYAYRASDGTFVKAGTTKGANISGYRCYFSIPASSNAKLNRIAFDGGTVTSIKQIDTTEKTIDNSWYNLQGQRVNKPTHGVYIHGGKKVVVR